MGIQLDIPLLGKWNFDGDGAGEIQLNTPAAQIADCISRKFVLWTWIYEPPIVALFSTIFGVLWLVPVARWYKLKKRLTPARKRTRPVLY